MEDIYAAFCVFLATVDNALETDDIDAQEARRIAVAARELAERMEEAADKQANRT